MRTIIYLLLIFLGVNLHAQDTIVKVDRTKIPANITEVNADEVIYRMPGYNDGPLFHLKISEIYSVTYRNGRTETFNTRSLSDLGSLLHRQMISLNSIDLTFGLVSLNWEINLGGDKFSLRIPVSSGISAFGKNSTTDGNYNNFYYTRFKMFSAGIDMLYYPKGQKHVLNYYCGLATETGLTKMMPGYFDDFPPYPYYAQKTWYGGAGIINGVLINVNDRMNISPYFTLGMKYMGNTSYYYNNRITMCRGGINMGIRFGKSSVVSTTKDVY